MILVGKIKNCAPAWRRVLLLSLVAGGALGYLDVINILTNGDLTPVRFFFLLIITDMVVFAAAGLVVLVLMTLFLPGRVLKYLSRPTVLQVPVRLLEAAILVLLMVGFLSLDPLKAGFDRQKLKRTIAPPARPRDEPITGRENPNVIILVLDTVRADHLSLYGYSRQTTPHLEYWSKEFLVCRNAVSPSPWTVPSHATLFTGLYPAEHGAHSILPQDLSRKNKNNVIPLGKRLTTLAEILQHHGYRTGGVITNPFLRPTLGFGQGFSTYLWSWNINCDFPMKSEAIVQFLLNDHWKAMFDKPQQTAYQLNERVFHWLELNGDSPFFLFVNYMDAHRPLHVSPPFCRHFPGQMDDFQFSVSFRQAIMDPQRAITPEEVAHLHSLYDGAILYLDYHLDRLLGRLREMGLYDETLIIITSDHGEFFGEHQLLDHGKEVYREVLEIPLLVKFPGSGKRGIIEERVHLVDLLPTILPALNIQTPPGLPGRDLGQPVSDMPLLCENYYARIVDLRMSYGERFRRVRRALYFENWKFIQSSDGEDELYEISADPGEEHNLVDRMPEKHDGLSRLLEQIIPAEQQDVPDAQPMEMDEETRARLKSLGYL